MKRTTLFLLTLLVGLNSPKGVCALLNLAQSPLFVGGTVPPNVFFQLDDSGSMDWEMLMKQYWEACAYDPDVTGSHSNSTSCGTQWQGDEGLRSYANNSFLNFNYIYNTSDNIYNVYTSGNAGSCSYSSFALNAIGACPSSGTNIDWRAYTSSLNSVYYNPTNIYFPWIYNCSSGVACADASFSAARSYPIQGTSNYSLTRNLAGGKYEVWIDDYGFSGTRPLRGNALNITTGANTLVDLWDSHVTIVLNASNVQVYSTTYAPTSAGMNPTQTLQATLTDGAACYNVLGPNSLVRSIFSGSLSYNSTGASGCLTIAQAQTNFANWYQYSRRRSMAAKSSMAYVINQFPTFRYGFNTINDNLMVQVPPLPATDYGPHNLDILSQLVNYVWQPQGTPLRSALDRVGKYYSNKISGMANPITQTCQQNYTILITDGYWTSSDSISSTIGDVDGDGVSKTLADVAYYYYKTDLSTLANIVAVSPWDPANWQHMVTFTMGFGLTGKLVAGADGWPTPSLAINGNWGNPFIDSTAIVDDLWHTAFNSKGNYFGAQNPTTAGKALSTVLTNIAQRNASAASAAQNSTVLNTGSQVYQATFNTSNWQGDVMAFPISLTGVIGTTPLWSANCMLTGGRCLNPVGTNPVLAPNNRVIITRNWTGANNGIPFRWPSNYASYKVSGSLPTNLTEFLANAPYPANTTTTSQINSNQTYGQALLDYLRGTRTKEIQFGGTFRNRSSLLADIINSNPAFVPGPYRLYPDSLEANPYSTFKQTYANRTPVIYDGANDGMLHGFNANTGKEILAYVPGTKQIYQNLPKLSLPTYSHSYFVDGTPIEADVYFSSAWHTILVGNLRNGGQSIFALDITNPANFSESNASQIYLWEFSDLNDPDLGNVSGNVTIAKVRTGANQSKWAAIIGNGYNNSQADGSASTTGKAALFILFIEQGIDGNWVADTDYIKIPVGTGSTTTPNGLGAPAAIDINSDYVVDYVYAGDLKGNIWKFDLTNNTPVNWKTSSSLLFTAYQTTSGDQPITAPLIVGAHPNGIQAGVMVYFGTGKYLEAIDNSTTGQTTQSFYGIWDKLDGSTVAKNTLLQQQITDQVTPSGSTNTYRVISNNSINWQTPNQNLGWSIDLILNGSGSNNGERQIALPILRNGNVIFTTLIPGADPCVFGGTGWIMEVNANNGGSPYASPFDINNDGKFTTADYIDIGFNGQHNFVPASGVQSGVGITPTPAVFLAPDKSSETKVLSGSQGLGTLNENLTVGPSGRQNWRQLR